MSDEQPGARNRSQPEAAGSLAGELTGALAAATITLPQVLAFGLVAFAPLGSDYFGHGMASAMIGTIVVGTIAALFGSMPGLISGARASTALVISLLISQLLAIGLQPAQSVALAMVAIVLAGAIQLLLGLFRVGELAKFIPYPVVAGFLNGTALSILVTQVRLLIDSIERGDHHLLQLVAIAAFLLVVLFQSLGRIISSLPDLLLALLFASLFHLGLEQQLGPLGGGTLPAIGHDSLVLQLTSMGALFNDIFYHTLFNVGSAAFSIALLATIETLLALNSGSGQGLVKPDGNRELIAQGAANIAAGLLGGLCGSGSSVRTIASERAGGRGRLSALFSAAILLLVLLTLASELDRIPEAVMIGVMAGAAWGMRDRWTGHLLSTWLRRGRHHLSNQGSDLLIVTLVTSITLFAGLVSAVAVGVVLSLAIFVRNQGRSLITRVYNGSMVHANVARDEASAACLNRYGEQIVTLELRGALFFGSSEQLIAEVSKATANGARMVILDLRQLNDIDATGLAALGLMATELAAVGVTLILANVPLERRIHHRSPKRDLRRSNNNSRWLWHRLQESGALTTLQRHGEIHEDLGVALFECEERLIARFVSRHGAPPLHHSALFNRFTADEIRILRRHLRRQPTSAGEILFRQGDHSDAVYFLRRGRAFVTLPLAGRGVSKRLMTILPGSLFGEMAMIDRAARSATVVTDQPSLCYRLDLESYHRLQQSHPQIAFKLVEGIGVLLSRRLRYSNQLVEWLSA